MLAVYSPTTMAPRRGGMLLLAALSLVGVVARLGLLLAVGQLRGFLTYEYWPPPLSYTNPFMRSMPYLAGMFACLYIDQKRQEEQGGISTLALVAASGSTAAAATAAGSYDDKDAAAVTASSEPDGMTVVAAALTASSEPDGMTVVVISSGAVAGGPACLELTGKSGSCGQSTGKPTVVLAMQTEQGTSVPPLGCWAALLQRLCSLAAHRWSVRAVDLVCLAVAVGLTFIGAGDNCECSSASLPCSAQLCTD